MLRVDVSEMSMDTRKGVVVAHDILHLQIEDWKNTCNKCTQINVISLYNQRDSRTWEIIKGSTNTTWWGFSFATLVVTHWDKNVG